MAREDQQVVLHGRNQPLVPYNGNQQPVVNSIGQLPNAYYGSQQPVLYSVDHMPNTYYSSHQSFRDNIRSISAALPPGTNFHYTHNEGTTTYMDTYKPPNPQYNTFTFNGPDSHVIYTGSATGSTTGSTTSSTTGFTTRSATSSGVNRHVICKDCRTEFGSVEKVRRHQEDNPLVCKEHQTCYSSWTEHAKQFWHAKDPKSNYQKEYTTKARLIESFITSYLVYFGSVLAVTIPKRPFSLYIFPP
ncbi:MAG: hypothetical protein LQ351_000355 [Letrouitia transgressa]|nr:MAG: hypothetical protein LQ351_000355 [Letrouitia transgressa]